MTELSSGAIANMLRSWDHCWPAPWLEKTVADAADRLDAQAAEIERLRASLRVNCLRYGGTHADADEVIFPTKEG